MIDTDETTWSLTKSQVLLIILISMVMAATASFLATREVVSEAQTKQELCELKLALNETNTSICGLQLVRCMDIANQLAAADPVLMTNQTTNQSFCCSAVGRCTPI